MNFQRSLQKSVDRLNDLYDDELRDAHIVLRTLPDGNRQRLSIEPQSKHADWRSDLGEAGTEDELQAFIRGLELASFDEIETLSEPPIGAT
jgi:hypothetical protein